MSRRIICSPQQLSPKIPRWRNENEYSKNRGGYGGFITPPDDHYSRARELRFATENAQGDRRLAVANYISFVQFSGTAENSNRRTCASEYKIVFRKTRATLSAYTVSKRGTF